MPLATVADRQVRPRRGAAVAGDPLSSPRWPRRSRPAPRPGALRGRARGDPAAAVLDLRGHAAGDGGAASPGRRRRPTATTGAPHATGTARWCLNGVAGPSRGRARPARRRPSGRDAGGGHRDGTTTGSTPSSSTLEQLARRPQRPGSPAGADRGRRGGRQARPAVLVRDQAAVRLAGAGAADQGAGRCDERAAARPTARCRRRCRRSRSSRRAPRSRWTGRSRAWSPAGTSGSRSPRSTRSRRCGRSSRSTAWTPGVRRRQGRRRRRADRRGAGRFGIKPELVPSGEQSTAGLLEDSPPYDEMFDPIGRVLLPRADIATETLAAGLIELGWEVDDVTAYRTVRAAPPPAPIRDAIKSGGFDAVLFTSSSTVRMSAKCCRPADVRTVTSSSRAGSQLCSGREAIGSSDVIVRTASKVSAVPQEHSPATWPQCASQAENVALLAATVAGYGHDEVVFETRALLRVSNGDAAEHVSCGRGGLQLGGLSRSRSGRGRGSARLRRSRRCMYPSPRRCSERLG